ncbi:MAG: hypothetical protein HeimC2_34550 [Candidatus Heimdallarchaeota archaeon LC_2]|nr:MAG: hypothetical protein HeimC2_34550 [Candidatus Heimdallarchaeota archaeon LC_2]
MIRLIEGKIKFALDDVDAAVEAYNKSKSTLVGIESSAMGIKGLLDYQFGEIAKKYREHDNVVQLINSSVSNLKEGGFYNTAITYLFDLVNYITINKLQENPLTYADQIDQLTKKSIKDKNDKKKYSAELSMLKGNFFRTSNRNDAAKEFENAAKEFSSLKLYKNHAESLVQWAELVRNGSLKKSEKILKIAIESAKKGNSDREIGFALLSLAKVKRILNELDEAKSLEKEGFDTLNKSGCNEECGTYYIEISRIIALTSTNDNELSIAIEYATKASKLFDEIEHKYGKTVSLFMQGLSRIAKGYVQEGLSMIKLTTINLNRLKKNDQVEYLNTHASHLVNALTSDTENEDFNTILEKHSENLHPLEKGSLFHLASIIKFHQDANEGIHLINNSLNLLEKYVKKNKDYQIYYDIAKERAEKLSQEAVGVSSNSIEATSGSFSMQTPSEGISKQEIAQPKFKKRGGPNLGKK